MAKKSKDVGLHLRKLGEVEIPLEKLEDDPQNLRINKGDVAPLVMSIRTFGFRTRLIVRPHPDPEKQKNGVFGVVCGSRRVFAARIVPEKEKVENIPCEAYEMDDRTARIISSLDNIATKPYDKEEKAEIYYRLWKDFKEDQSALARQLGVSQQEISYHLSMYMAKMAAESEGLVVCDMRRKEFKEVAKRGVRVVSRGEARKAFKMLKSRQAVGSERLSVVRRDGEGGVVSAGPQAEDTETVRSIEAQEPETRKQTMKEVLDMMWRPALFKYTEESEYLHEILKRDDILTKIPKKFTPEMTYICRGSAPFKGFFPVVKLLPPYENVTVLVCPNCGNVLRSAGKEGAPVVCLDCGFPSDRVWRKVGGG